MGVGATQTYFYIISVLCWSIVENMMTRILISTPTMMSIQRKKKTKKYTSVITQSMRLINRQYFAWWSIQNEYIYKKKYTVKRCTKYLWRWTLENAASSIRHTHGMGNRNRIINDIWTTDTLWKTQTMPLVWNAWQLHSLTHTLCMSVSGHLIPA